MTTGSRECGCGGGDPFTKGALPHKTSQTQKVPPPTSISTTASPRKKSPPQMLAGYLLQLGAADAGQGLLQAVPKGQQRRFFKGLADELHAHGHLTFGTKPHRK